MALQYLNKERQDIVSICANYFLAWQIHSTRLLRQIFHPNAQYIILNKNSSFNGLTEIKSYWKRNRIRQRKLKINYKIIDFCQENSEIAFIASFYDEEELQNQMIYGVMVLTIENGKISTLTEKYVKWLPQSQDIKGLLRDLEHHGIAEYFHNFGSS